MNHFTIKIPCKKYVKAYMENNRGIPVDLKHLPELHDGFRYLLNKKPKPRQSVSAAIYTDTVTIIIPPDWFYRYDWEMTKENIFDLNRIVEQKVKYLMRQFVGLNSGLGISVSSSIREFQERFEFPEQTWSFENIKKEFYRHGHIWKLKALQDLKSEININLLDDLSEVGIISKKVKIVYKLKKELND